MGHYNVCNKDFKNSILLEFIFILHLCGSVAPNSMEFFFFYCIDHLEMSSRPG